MAMEGMIRALRTLADRMETGELTPISLRISHDTGHIPIYGLMFASHPDGAIHVEIDFLDRELATQYSAWIDDTYALTEGRMGLPQVRRES